jgi:hypothetical protein
MDAIAERLGDGAGQGSDDKRVRGAGGRPRAPR